MAKSNEVRPADLDDGNLIQALAEAKDDYLKLRFRHATGQLPSFTALPKARKQVARILTELRSREIAAAEALDAKEHA